MGGTFDFKRSLSLIQDLQAAVEIGEANLSDVAGREIILKLRFQLLQVRFINATAVVFDLDVQQVFFARCLDADGNRFRRIVESVQNRVLDEGLDADLWNQEIVVLVGDFNLDVQPFLKTHFLQHNVIVHIDNFIF